MPEIPGPQAKYNQQQQWQPQPQRHYEIIKQSNFLSGPGNGMARTREMGKMAARSYSLLRLLQLLSWHEYFPSLCIQLVFVPLSLPRKCWTKKENNMRTILHLDSGLLRFRKIKTGNVWIHPTCNTISTYKIYIFCLKIIL